MHGYYCTLFHWTNRLKWFKPNKLPPSHRICDEISEVTSLVRQCRSCDINYDENIVKIEGDFSGKPNSRLHNNEYSSDVSVIDHEHTPDNVSDCVNKSGIPIKQTKKKSFKYLPFLVNSKKFHVVGDKEDDGDQIIVTGKTKLSYLKYQWVNELHAMDDSRSYGKSRFLCNIKYYYIFF